MFITICYIYLTYSDNRLKKSQLSALVEMFCSHIPRSSLLIQRVVLSHSLGRMPRILKPGALSISGFCDDAMESITLETLMEKGGKQVLEISPKQYVDLSHDWTLFIGSSSPVIKKCNPTNKLTNQSEMYLLIEATPPYIDRNGHVHLRKVPADQAVKLSRLTKPIAWKSGEPFGIVVKASVEQCAKTGMAFLDGVLELDDGLLVEHIATVGIRGRAQSLLSRKASLQQQALLQSQLSTTDHQPNQIDHQPNPTDHQPSTTDQQPNPTGHQPNTTDHQPNTTDHQPNPTDHQPNPTDHQPNTTDHQPNTTDHQPNPTNHQPNPTDHQPNPTDHQPNPTDHQTSSHKVPNVLVYTDSDDKEPDHYLMVREVLQQCLHPDHYVIYHLTKSQILNHPWIDNTALLVLSSELEMKESVEATNKIKCFLDSGGKVMNFSSRLYLPDCISIKKQNWNASIIDVEYYNKSLENTKSLKCLHRGYLFSINTSPEQNGTDLSILAKCEDQPVIIEIKSKGHGTALLCQVHLDVDPSKDKTVNSEEFAELKKSNQTRYEVLSDLFSRLGVVCSLGITPSITPCYIHSNSGRAQDSFLNTVKGRLKEGCLHSRLSTLQFVDTFLLDKEIDSECIPVITTHPKAVNFDMEAYQNHLHTKVLGNVVLYSEVIPTTMTLFEGFMFQVEENVGTVAIATRMTQGKGRGGNAWISPIGCAMFSVHVRIPIQSNLGQRLPFLQHIASAAVVEAVRSLDGYENIDLRLKWPNDIYYGDKMKLGGVIVNSCCWENKFHAIIGCGFNVNNSDPTICINDLVARHNHECDTNLLPLTRELLIARTLTYIERIIENFQLYGKDSFLPIYYKHWLHSDMQVHLEKEDGPEVEIVGLDDMGFLAVKNQSGQVVSVQPDGNSFDMMKNLLVTKARP
ncbi:biotin--protein ligase-like [Antedon mediterranea]|uniref:biotin--protein ligase-like n=1 Tax=Antedon mediterranea TaxID=105859 RepID=UPI003AF99E79